MRPNTPRLIERNTLNLIIDSLLFTTCGAIIFIGLLLGFVIPTGNAPPQQKYLWELHRHDWGEIHLYLALSFLGLLIVHLILHWSWIKGCAAKYFPKPSYLWVFAVAPFALVLLIWLAYPRTTENTGKSEGFEAAAAPAETSALEPLGSGAHSAERKHEGRGRYGRD